VNGSVPCPVCPELVGVDDETNSGRCVTLPAAVGVAGVVGAVGATTLAPLTVPGEGEVTGAGGTTGLAAGGFAAEAGDALFVVFDGGELLVHVAGGELLAQVGGPVLVVGVVVGEDSPVQPVCAGLVWPMPWLLSHS
jgi:hypothetical protein